MSQLKQTCLKIEEQIKLNAELLSELGKDRNATLKEIGNRLHPLALLSNDEESDNRVEKLNGDVSQKKKYSHVDYSVLGDTRREIGILTTYKSSNHPGRPKKIDYSVLDDIGHSTLRNDLSNTSDKTSIIPFKGSVHT